MSMISRSITLDLIFARCMRRAQLEGLLDAGDDIPVLRVTVPEDQSIWDHERSVKLADHGTGMNRRVLGKVRDSND